MNSRKRSRVFFMLFTLLGWSIAFALGVVFLPRAWHRHAERFPLIQQAAWNQLLQSRQEELASNRWKEQRPLNIFIGDSHIELGRWYDLFEGSVATRNCGLSRAKIGDVTKLIEAIPDTGAAALIVMCGINNLGANQSITECLDQYEKLLAAARKRISGKVLVLSVMPVQTSMMDRKSTSLNDAVVQFNQQLEQLCHRAGVSFVDVNRELTDSSNALRDAWTADGLHLNAAGYGKLAETIRPFLAGAAKP